MYETTTLQLAEQRSEDRLREAEPRQRPIALRAPRKRYAGRSSAVVWGTERYSGLLLKLPRTTRYAGHGRGRRNLSEKEGPRRSTEPVSHLNKERQASNTISERSVW